MIGSDIENGIFTKPIKLDEIIKYFIYNLKEFIKFKMNKFTLLVTIIVFSFFKVIDTGTKIIRLGHGLSTSHSVMGMVHFGEKLEGYLMVSSRFKYIQVNS